MLKDYINIDLIDQFVRKNAKYNIFVTVLKLSENGKKS